MKQGKRYQVIDVPSLEGGINASRRELVVHNGEWVADAVVMTRCGSQMVVPRFFAPNLHYGETVTAVGQDTVFMNTLGISFLTIGVQGSQFKVLAEHVIYHSSHPFLLVIERTVQLPVQGKAPYARRHLVLPRQVRGGEFGEYPDCKELRVVEESHGSCTSFEWVSLSELSRAASVNSAKLAEDFLWPPYLEMPRNQCPFVITEKEHALKAGLLIDSSDTLDRSNKKSLVSIVKHRNWENMVWVALPMARAILHLTNLHFETGDRSQEVSLLHSRDT